MPLLDVRADHLKIVQDILQQFVPERAVWAFGSRAKWLAKEYSDLDLCIVGKTPLSFRTLGLIEEAFEESDLPYKVDVADWATTSDSFRKIIEQDRVVVQEKGRGCVVRARPFRELYSIPLRNGLTKPKAVRGAGTKMVNMGELFANPRLINVDMDRVPLNEAESKSSMLEPDDLLFARQSLVLSGAGKCSIFVCDGEEVCFESHVIRCRLNKDLADPHFYFYFFGSAAGRRLIETIVEQGAGASGIRGSDLAELSVPWVDPSVQRCIAQYLRHLDDKIDCNRRINQILEAMAQAIFKSWFVDFDPVKAKIAAKAEGRDPLRSGMTAISGKPDAELDTLPPEQFASIAATAALFPDEMEESELGEIPKGWTVCPLPACIDINPARVLKKGAVAPYLDMANVPTNAARVDNVVPRAFGSGSKFINGDTLLARITPCLENGKTAYVDFLAESEVGWGSTEFIVLRPKGDLPLPFAYFLCRHPEFRAFAISQMAGTSGRQRVPNDCFGAYRLVKPSPQVADAFGKQAALFMRQINAQDEASKTLASLRDALLPKLLSGELHVHNTEAEATA